MVGDIMNNNDSNKKCPVCGADVFDNNYKFCYKCGYKFESVKHNQLFDFSIVNDVKNKLKETSDEVKKNIGIESKPKEEKKEETKELKEEKTKKSKFSFFNMNESKKDYMGEYLNGLSEQVSKSTRNNFIKDYPISYDEKDRRIEEMATLVFGLGTLAGTVAIAVFSFGYIGKLTYEEIETVDMGAF